MFYYGYARTHELREVFNGLRYIVRSGATWRMMPNDLLLPSLRGLGLTRLRRGPVFIRSIYAVFCLVAVAAVAACEDVIGPGTKVPAQIIWRTPVTDRFVGPVAPATDGERVYAAAIGRGIVAFDAGTGARLWQSGPFTYSTPGTVVARGGRVFAADTIAYAFDAATGRRQWQFSGRGNASLTDYAVDERAFYYGTDARQVYALSVEDGTLLWQIDLGPTWQNGSHVRGTVVSGDTVYVAAKQHHSPNGYYSSGWMVALDRYTGNEFWRYQYGDGTDSRDFVRAPTVAGRFLLVSDFSGSAFMAIDRFSGRLHWRVKGEPGFAGFFTSPTARDGTAYVAGSDTYVYAVDLETGKIRWRTQPVFGGNFSHAICGNAVFALHGQMSVLDRQSGRVLGFLFDDGDYPTSRFAVASDRVFAVGSTAVYAIRCS